MSSTFLRGLALVELVGIDGPIGVSELARRLGMDKASVSRMVTAASADGWLTRSATGVVLGPRLPVLAHHSDLAKVLRDAQPVVDAVAGVTGLFAQAYVGVGRSAMPVLDGGRPPVGLPRPPGFDMPLWTIASGRALATLMDPARLAAIVPDGPLPADPALDDVLHQLEGGSDSTPVVRDPSGEVATSPTGADFLREVEEVRVTGVAFDRGGLHPLIHCIAVPWPGFLEPAAVCVIGSAADVSAAAELAEAVLREAVLPGATRDSVVQRAAGHHRPR